MIGSLDAVTQAESTPVTADDDVYHYNDAGQITAEDHCYAYYYAGG
jgi:hypothetical protein